MYIRSTGAISAQYSFGKQPLLHQLVKANGNRMNCIEPDYKTIIDPKLIRRMSRIIRMGVAAAMDCLQKASVEKPDAIITGTAYGCLEDTGQFLSRMIEFEETLLNPTAFIQSTHNTIGAQIGLLLQCNNYNNAFVHRGFSFQSAMQDAMMLIHEQDAETVLVGAVDEITEYSHTILSRFNLYKSLSDLETETKNNSKTNGTIAGEGAAFFIVSNKTNPDNLAKICSMETLYKPTGDLEVQQWIQQFLKNNDIASDSIDLIIAGRNSDKKSDEFYNRLLSDFDKSIPVLDYKKLCGEYPTAISFATWLAVNIIKQSYVPETLELNSGENKPIKKVLIVDQYLGIHNSLLLLESC